MMQSKENYVWQEHWLFQWVDIGDLVSGYDQPVHATMDEAE